MAGTASDPFFWNDWQGDPSLRLCSLAAQGLWMRLLCIAAESTPKGYVLIQGKNPSFEQIARLAGTTPQEIESLVSELESAGVFSRTKERVIYSRRMVRVEKSREKASKGGKIGGRVTHEKHLGIHATRGKLSEPPCEPPCEYPASTARARPSPSPSPLPFPSPEEQERKKKKEEIRPPKKADLPTPLPSDFDLALRAYNLVATECHWPKAQSLTSRRKTSMKARLAECGGVDGWMAAMEKARACPHLRGETRRAPGYENWRPSIDFFLQQSSFTKLMEGNFDGQHGNGNGSVAGHGGSGGKPSAHDDFFQAALRVAARRTSPDHGASDGVERALLEAGDATEPDGVGS